MFETPAEQRCIDLYFQTSALEARGIFADPGGARMKRARFPNAKQLEESVVHLATLAELRDERPTYEATT